MKPTCGFCPAATLRRCLPPTSAASRRSFASARAAASSGSSSRPPTSPRSSPTSRRSPTTSYVRPRPEFRERLENGEALDDLLFEAYAAVREARWRESQQRMFDVQMMGGIVLHEGDIAEMKTGEGKTFVASLALYLNALPGTGVHLVTVNDYLAKRDAEWNRPRLRAARDDRRRDPEHDAVHPAQGSSTRPTSPTARTPSSASTTCATTWRSRRRASSSAATPSRSSTRSTRS